MDIDGQLNVILDIDGLFKTINPFDQFSVMYGWIFTFSTFSF